MLFLLAVTVCLSSCTAAPTFEPNDEFQEIVFQETGIEINEGMLLEFVSLQETTASTDARSFRTVTPCNPYFKGCFDSMELLTFLRYHGMTLDPLDGELEQVTPAFANYYQDNADQAYMDNLTIIDDLPIQMSNGTFTRDTSTMTFTWYINEQFTHQGFEMPFSKLPDVSACDGVIEVGLQMDWNGNSWFREWPAFVQLTDYPDCEIIDLCNQCVFYDFDPDCSVPSYLVTEPYKWDFNHDLEINMTDLLYMYQHYGNCATS